MIGDYKIVKDKSGFYRAYYRPWWMPFYFFYYGGDHPYRIFRDKKEKEKQFLELACKDHAEGKHKHFYSFFGVMDFILSALFIFLIFSIFMIGHK